MCSLAGVPLVWWSQIGLFLDFLGFLIFAVDLYRDYSRHRRAELFRSGAESAIRLGDTQPDLELLADADQASKARFEYRRMIAQIDRGTVALAWDVLKSSGGWSGNDTPRYVEMAKIFADAAVQAPSSPYRRPPMYFGLWLVALGFLLQFVGNWPCS